jgi:transcriptional regulator with XRE-family HTH domain
MAAGLTEHLADNLRRFRHAAELTQGPRLTEHLAANLRRFRHAAELTQGQLGARTGLRQNYISSLERGLRPARTSHLDRLASALGVTVFDLLDVDPRAAAPAAHRAGDDTAHVGR